MNASGEVTVSPIVLVPGVLGESDDGDLALPRRDHNLFERIIRNPLPPGSTPKERECAEMLCAVLQNAPGIRYGLMAWLGELTGYDGVPFDELDLHIETEQSVYGKRDDLRITGRYAESEEDALALLWTIEIKVGAPFTYGSSVAYDGDDMEDDPEAVSQIANYDYWLTHQEALHKAGFVLGIRDRYGELPHRLANKWVCITWGRLAAQLRVITTQDEQLEPIDQFLGRHLFGFIRKHFGEERQSMDDQLDFDDIAFLRIFAQVGARTSEHVNALVEGLRPLLRDLKIGVGPLKSQKQLYGTGRRHILWQGLAAPLQQPWLYIGICLLPRLSYRISIEMYRGFEHRKAIYKLFEAYLPALVAANTNWRLESWDRSSLQLLADEIELEPLHTVDDQFDYLSAYTIRSLTALKDSGLIDEIRRIVKE